MRDLTSESRRISLHAIVRNVENAQATGGERIAPSEVGLPLGPPEVVSSTVDFDNNSVTVEEEIDSRHQPPFEHLVLSCRSWQSVATQKLKETRFECTLGRGNGAALSQQSSQHCWTLAPFGYERIKATEKPEFSGHAPSQGALECQLDLVHRGDRPEIDEGAAYCRHRNTAKHRGITGFNPAEVADSSAIATAEMPSRAHVDAAGLESVELPDSRCGRTAYPHFTGRPQAFLDKSALPG